MTPEFRLEQGPIPPAEAHALMSANWPNYLIEPGDIPHSPEKITMSREESRKRNLSWSVRREPGNELAASAYAFLIHADEELPNTGWTFAVQAVVRPIPEPNCLCLVAVNVAPEFRGRGLSSRLIVAAKDTAHDLGLRSVIVPLRPTHKADFPRMPMADYVALRDPEGEPRDPWLRTHVRCGAELLNVCAESVVIKATLPRWRAWTGAALDVPGEFDLPGGLAPLHVDLVQNLGVYREPNVWARYRL